jgi:hypothetical protein
MSEEGRQAMGDDDRDEKRQDMREEMRQAWTDVGERFTALGDAVRHRGGTGRTATPGSEGDGGALREAFDKVMAAVRELGEQASTVVKDPDVRAHTREVAQSLNSALSATVDRIGGEVDALARKAKRSGRADPPSPGSSPTA